MNKGWQKKYKVALMERNPALKRLKIDEAFQAVLLRMNETNSGNEHHRLENAIKILKALRSG